MTDTSDPNRKLHTPPDLSIRQLKKSFGPNQVLHGIDLEIRSGEFVGLMGPNGAGKSTLIKILDGVYSANSGDIRLGGEHVRSLGGRRDVGFIHQDLGLVDELSIVDNLRLGREPLRLVGPVLNKRAERAAAQRALEAVSLDYPVDGLVGELAPGEKTLVAVARAFDRGASIIFVDESTSTLPPREARRVIETLAASVSQGATVIMVTHKLNEILDATDRVVVLIDGRIVADESTAGLDRPALVRMLLQHEASRAEREAGDRDDHQPKGDTLLEMREVYGGRAGPVSLEVRAGEVIGLTGLPGSGLHDVGYLASGAMRPQAGTLTIKKELRRAFVPPHRETQGGFASLSVRQNMTISALGRWRTAIRLLAGAKEARACQNMATELSVHPPRIDAEFGVLSGGNKQKVVFGRALLREPQIYVLCEPTRGVDVGTRSEIYRLIGEMKGHGAGILLVTSDAEDLFAVCDRIGVIEEGQPVKLRPIKEMQLAELETMV